MSEDDAGRPAGSRAQPVAEDASSRWPFSFLPKRFGEGLTGPLIPIYAAAFTGATAAKIGAMEGLFQALAVLGAFVWGRTSDQVGKRKAFIVLGLAGSGVSFLGMALASSFWVLFAWRAVFGFMAAALGAVGGALVADAATPGNIGEKMGRLQAISGVGYVGGLVAGMLLVTVRPTSEAFAVAAVVTLASVVLALAWIREPEAHLDRDEVLDLFRNVRIPFTLGVQRRTFNPLVMLHRPKFVGTERRAWAYLGAIALSFVGTTAGFVLFPLYLTEIGLSQSAVFALFIVNAAISAALYGPMGKLADRIGYRPMQLGAIGTRSAMFVVLLVPLAAGVASAAVFLMLAGVSWAILNTTGPAALFRSMRIREKGELIALYNMAAGGGSLVGALLGGLVAGAFGFTVLFAVGAVIVAISVVVLATAVYPRSTPDTASAM